MQERRNSSALAIEIHLSCTNQIDMKMLSAKCQSFCSGLNMLRWFHSPDFD